VYQLEEYGLTRKITKKIDNTQVINSMDKRNLLYDYRTNINHTLKKNPLNLTDLQDFITCYHTANRNKRKETFHRTENPEGRWRKFSYEEILARDKTY
jgi:type I restriction enzyme M protein